jgi:hypothetical protein
MLLSAQNRPISGGLNIESFNLKFTEKINMIGRYAGPQEIIDTLAGE